MSVSITFRRVPYPIPVCGWQSFATAPYIACKLYIVYDAMYASNASAQKQRNASQWSASGDRDLACSNSSVGHAYNFKYSLYAGCKGRCLVRYDNERSKGDHRHYGEQEEAYVFRSIDRLIEDFIADVERLGN